MPVRQSARERVLPASRRSLAAALLLRYGWEENAWLVLKDPLPDARCFLIHRLNPLGVEAEQIAQRLLIEKDAAVLAGLIQAIGEFPAEDLENDTYLELLDRVKSHFLRHPDARVHSSVLWLLNQWGQSRWLSQATNGLRSASRKAREWYVDGHGNTMVRMPMPGGPFEIAIAETTVGQFQLFNPNKISSSHTPTSDCPVVRVNWRDAARFCNWLTLEEGLGEDQLCYPEPTASTPNVQLYPDFRKRRGYRLPTIEELRFSQSGTSLQREYYPCDAGLIPRYVVCEPASDNQTWPVGKVKPNCLGLFDMAGSVQEWTSDADVDDRRAVCGSRYKQTVAEMLRRFSLDRDEIFYAPATQYTFIGFRIVRSAPEP